MEVEPRTGRLALAGNHISYRMAGQGPAVVLVKPHRRPKDYELLRVLSGRFLTIQIEPLGFGASDRPREYPQVGLDEQILAVLDHEMVDRFVIWGYSKGGAMAATIARACSRAAAMVAGGFSLVTMPTDGQLARMDREQRVPVADRAFWHLYKGYDWLAELAAMSCPRLIYVGADDRTFARGVRRTREPLMQGQVKVIEFDGLDHQTCNAEPAVSARIVPTVLDWLNNVVGRRW